MITLHEQLPLVRMERGEVIHYEESWLHDVILDAARRSGIDDAWFAGHIAHGIAIYLKERFNESSISIDELFLKIRTTLEAVGFPNVAGHVEPSLPSSRICLEHLVDQAEQGYELFFFDLLSRELRTVCGQRVSKVVCHDLRPAVARLCGAKRWNRRCEALRDEIADFVAHDLARRAAPDRQLAVLLR